MIEKWLEKRSKSVQIKKQFENLEKEKGRLFNEMKVQGGSHSIPDGQICSGRCLHS